MAPDVNALPATEPANRPADRPADRPAEPELTLAASDGAPCAACAGASAQHTAQHTEASAPASAHVYAIGRIEARFPRLSVEKEFAQVAGRGDGAGQTDVELMRSVLSQHRYLARMMCWVLLVREIETYILVPADPVELQLLVDALRPDPGPGDLDVVIGHRGPVAPPDVCNGLTVPLVAVDQIYSFDRASFRSSIPRPDGMSDERFEAVSSQVLDLILQVADNAGGTDDHRALNYLAMRYPEIYVRTARAFAEDFSLTGVDVQRSPLGGGRVVVDCVFTYTSRRAGFTEKAAVTVDVTDRFPFLVNRLSTYYDRFTTQ